MLILITNFIFFLCHKIRSRFYPGRTVDCNHEEILSLQIKHLLMLDLQALQLKPFTPITSVLRHYLFSLPFQDPTDEFQEVEDSSRSSSSQD